MRTSSEDNREQLYGTDEGAPEAVPSSTRRAVLGLTAGGLAQATSGLLLPAWICDEVSAAKHSVGAEHRGKRRRHRRRHHASHISAAAFLALSQPIGIPRDKQTPFTLSMDLVIFNFITEDNGYVSPTRSGTYQLDLFLTWVWNGTGSGICDTGIHVVDTSGREQVYTTRTLLSQPLTTASHSQLLRLDEGDRLQVIGQVTTEQDFVTPVQVTAGAMSLYAIET